MCSRGEAVLEVAAVTGEAVVVIAAVVGAVTVLVDPGLRDDSIFNTGGSGRGGGGGGGGGSTTLGAWSGSTLSPVVADDGGTCSSLKSMKPVSLLSLRSCIATIAAI